MKDYFTQSDYGIKLQKMNKRRKRAGIEIREMPYLLNALSCGPLLYLETLEAIPRSGLSGRREHCVARENAFRSLTWIVVKQTNPQS